MSGIVGFWNVDGRPIDPDRLAAMSSTLRHRGADGEDIRIKGSIGLAHQHVWVTDEEIGERQPLVGRSGVALVMDGRLDNRDELIAALELPASTSDAAIALAAYERWGDEFGARLNGEFVAAIVDASERRIVLIRDAIGTRPLYYFNGPRLFAFASEIKALLAHPEIPRQPDEDGLADYLMIGARPLDRQHITCFRHICAVVPAHVVLVTPDGIVTRRYWDFDTSRRLQLASFEEYVEAFRERFSEAVRRRLRGRRPVAVSVSGGLDSSSIFCEAETLRRAAAAECSDVIGISYTGSPGTDADERRYVELIERRYGMPIDRFPMEPLTGIVEGTDDQVRAVEAPFLDYMHGATRELHRRASARGVRVLLSGQWGDQVLFSSAYLVDLFNDLAWFTFFRHIRAYERWLGRDVARELTRRFTVDAARHHIPRAIVPPLKWVRRRLLGVDPPKTWFSDAFLRRGLRFANRPATVGDGFHSAHARSIYIEARSKYHVQCMEWNDKVCALNGLVPTFPFLDRDLVALLMAMPGDVQNRDGMPRALIREALRGVLPDEIRARTWKADFSGLVNVGVAQDARTIADALGPDSLAIRLGYVDAGRIQSAIARLVSGLSARTCTDGWDLSDLYGLERWLQVFWNGNPEIA